MEAWVAARVPAVHRVPGAIPATDMLLQLPCPRRYCQALLLPLLLLLRLTPAT